jgi:hypothetical protein
MSTFSESTRAKAINLANCSHRERARSRTRYAIASQAISVHTTAPKVAPKPCFGHSTVFGGEEGRVTIESKSATDAIDRKQQSARDL